MSEQTFLFQRVHFPIRLVESDSGPKSLRLYGFVELDPGTRKPLPTFCCSAVPTPFVAAIGWDPEWPVATSDEMRETWDFDAKAPDSGYYSMPGTIAALTGAPFEIIAETDREARDDAREECQGNW